MYKMIEKIFLQFIQSKSFNSSFGNILGNLELSKIQVIVKIQSIELDCNNKDKSEYLGGSWHLEGMDYEHIYGTCIYYFEMDNIESSYLEFRESIEDPTDNPQSDNVWVWENHGVIHGQISNKYLGKIKLNKGNCIIYKNIYQHHVTKFKLNNKNKNGKRSILVFFIIDPKYKIISTKYVPIQQKNIMLNILKVLLKNDLNIEGIIEIIVEYLPCFTIKQAKQFRDKLMFARKFYVDEINSSFYEREVTFCEH